MRPLNRRALHRHRHRHRPLPERQVDLHAAERAPGGDLERPPRHRQARRLRGGRPRTRRRHEEGASQAPQLPRASRLRAALPHPPHRRPGEASGPPPGFRGTAPPPRARPSPRPSSAPPFGSSSSSRPASRRSSTPPGSSAPTPDRHGPSGRSPGSGNMKRTPHHLARSSLSLGACLPRARSTAAVNPPPCPMRSEPEGRIDSNVR